MSSNQEHVDVRSYRTVFELERRIYRIDRFRLNPAGVPLRGVLYFLGLLLVIWVAGAAPLLGWAIARLPWYVRYLAGPMGTAALLTVVRVDGRPFHLAARALCTGMLAPRRLAGLRSRAGVDGVWRPPAILLLPDGSDPWLRRFRFRGPGAVLVRASHELVARGVARRWRRWPNGPAHITLGPPANAASSAEGSPSPRAGRASRPGRVLHLKPGAVLTVRGGSGRRVLVDRVSREARRVTASEVS